MISTREIWNNFYDDTLEQFKEEKCYIRNISMLMCILQKEFLKLKLKVQDCEEKCTPQNNNRTSCNETNRDKTCILNSSSDKENSVDIFFDNFFTSVENSGETPKEEIDVSKFVIDDSLEERNIFKSPKLNKSKHLSKGMKHKGKVRRNILDSASPNDSYKEKNIFSVIEGTPNKSKRNKKMKSIVLSENILKLKPLSISASSTISINVDNSIGEEANDIEQDIKLFRDLKNAANIENDTTITPISTVTPSAKHNLLKEKNQYVDSFDWFPTKKTVNETENQQRKRECDIVCDDCEKFFASNSDTSRVKCLHRKKKYKTDILTPPGYWNPEFSPTQTSNVDF